MAVHLFKRSLYTARSCLRARIPRRANPGISHQLQQLDEDEATEDYGDMEADFTSLNKTHRQFEAEQQQQRDRIRQFMIKHKYFRDAKLPNLLLHSEKEQMRLLHERDPEEWSVERLAESFPTTADTVQKILRAKWRPRNLQRIRVHDEAVISNWQQLKSGKIDVNIPKPLLEHLQKFAQRKKEDLQQLTPEQWPTRPALPVPKGNEFQALITSCGKQQQSLQVQQLTAGDKYSAVAPPRPNDEETYLLDKVHNKRKMRLQDLQAELQLLPTSALQANAKLAVETINNPGGTGHLPSFINKFESSEVVISVEDQKRYEMTRVKDRIAIPRKLYREGATYRVEDAYYDDDGEFLYRVPGMTGK